MAQSSGPISQGTTSERQFTDVQWRDVFGDEPGVVGDLDGTAYALNLSGGGDIVNVGSTTQISTARVAGFAHRIPQSNPEPITIPAAVGSTRTDIIGLRYDPAYTGLPGPVRLYRTIGSTSAVPSYDSAPPGVEDLPLWSITRSVGQALSLATVNRMFPRIAPVLDLPTGAAMPTSSPLGTLLYQDFTLYRRKLVSGSPAWATASTPATLSNGGTSGALAGSAPPAGTPLLTKTYYGSVVHNANGDGQVVFPGGAFPNGLVAVDLIHYSPGTPPSNDLEFVPWGATLSSVNTRCYGPTGAVFGGTGIALICTAIGW